MKKIILWRQEENWNFRNLKEPANQILLNKINSGWVLQSQEVPLKSKGGINRRGLRVEVNQQIKIASPDWQLLLRPLATSPITQIQS